jgi:hypothetical protein
MAKESKPRKKIYTKKKKFIKCEGWTCPTLTQVKQQTKTTPPPTTKPKPHKHHRQHHQQHQQTTTTTTTTQTPMEQHKTFGNTKTPPT